jgi:hypothetical protein
MTTDHALEPTTRKDGSPTLPARGYSWKPFEPVHGAYSGAEIDKRALQVRHQLFDLAPWLADEPVYVIPVARFVRVEARSQLLAEAIASKTDAQGILSVGSRMLEAATACDRLAAKLGDDLGLSPLGKAKLKAMTAAGEIGAEGLAELLERGRKARIAAGQLDAEEVEPP